LCSFYGDCSKCIQSGCGWCNGDGNGGKPVCLSHDVNAKFRGLVDGLTS